MQKLWFAACVLVCAGALAGCKPSRAPDDGPIMDMATGAHIDPGSSEDVKVAPDGRPYQFRAVCTEKEKHQGKEHILSKWTEDEAAVRDLGQYHSDWKAKGHQWVVQRREKPDRH